MKAFIICYNRLTWMKNLAEYLSDTGCEVILIDNKSEYPPLIEWYQSCPYTVYFLPKNMGHQALWIADILKNYKDQYYIVTDHDLDLTDVPKDYINILMGGLNEFPEVIKSGLSLRIDDLPKNDYTKEVIKWESKFWEKKRKGFYLADVDTTFALYDREREFGVLPNNRFFSAVRSPEPYTAKHLPWYNTKDNMSEEEQFYQDNTNTYWSEKFKALI